MLINLAFKLQSINTGVFLSLTQVYGNIGLLPFPNVIFPWRPVCVEIANSQAVYSSVNHKQLQFNLTAVLTTMT